MGCNCGGGRTLSVTRAAQPVTPPQGYSVIPHARPANTSGGVVVPLNNQIIPPARPVNQRTTV